MPTLKSQILRAALESVDATPATPETPVETPAPVVEQPTATDTPAPVETPAVAEETSTETPPPTEEVPAATTTDTTSEAKTDTPVESPVVETAADAPTDVAVTLPVDEVIDGHFALNEAVANVEEVDAALQQLHTTAASLESLSQLMADAQRNGGMTPDARNFAQMSLESILATIDRTPDKDLPSMESFGGTSSRNAATNLSMETVAEHAEKIWKAIKAAILQAKKFIIDLFKRLFNESVKIKESADQLIAKSKGAEQITGEIKINPVIGRFFAKDKDAVRVLSSLEELATECVLYDEKGGAEMSDAFRSLAEIAKDPSKLTSGSNLDLGSPLIPPRLFKNRKEQADVLVASTDVLPGGKQFYIQIYTKDMLSFVKAATKTSPYRVWAESVEVENIPESIDRLSPQTAEEIGKKVLEIVGVVKKAERIVSLNEQMVKNLDNPDFSNAQGGENISQRTAFRLVMNLFQGKVTANGKASSLVSAHALSACRAMISVADASLKKAA